jgi:ketosteroid isomerase-like protein
MVSAARPNGITLTPSAETLRSHIQALFAEAAKQGARNTLTTEDVTGFGSYAVETGKWVATSADGKHLDHGQYMTFYQKADGGWKIYRDTWNSSMPKQ